MPTMLADFYWCAVFDNRFQQFCPQQIEEAQAASQEKGEKKSKEFALP